MWGYYSSCTGTFFYIQLHSRNANHTLGITEKKKIHDQKPSGKDISRGFTSPQIRGDTCPSQHSEIQPRLPSFQRELQKLCWRTLTYFNICTDQELRI